MLVAGSYSLSTWSYFGMIGSVNSRAEPDGILEKFNIEIRSVYAGMSKVKRM